MQHGLSDLVREVAVSEFVTPAKRAGSTRLSIAVRDLMNVLRTKNFPLRNWPQVCSAIQTRKFLRENGLEIERVEGPPSGLSPKVVVLYRIRQDSAGTAQFGDKLPPQRTQEETPEEWAERITLKLSGLLKEELAEYGGAEGFIRWVRSEDEKPANESAA